MKIEDIFNQLKKDSIGTNKRCIIKTNKKQIAKKTLVLLLTSLSLICSVGCNSNNYTNIFDNNNNYSTNDELDYSAYDISTYKIARINELLTENGLTEYDFKDNRRIYNYSIDDYKKLIDLDESYLYGFYLLADNASFTTMLNSLGYSSLDYFLIRNNYVDNNGKPSMEVWNDSDNKTINDIMVQELKGKVK